MSQSDKKKVEMAASNIKERISYFGSDKFRADFTVEVMESLDRFEAHRRDNLFAIVMPSGSGKTNLCDKYGFLDIDRLTTKGEHDYLNDLRIDALSGKGSWDKHNKIWLTMVNETLDMMPISRPTLIMVHSEILALSIGAWPVAGMAPSDELFQAVYRQKEEAGNKAGAMLMASNREEFMHHTNIVMQSKSFFRTYDKCEERVLMILGLKGIPCACPYKYTRRVKNDEYSDDVPDWITQGEKDKLNVQELLDLFACGKVPKEALDYFMKSKEIPASFGFGMRKNEWSMMFAELRYSKSIPANFDKSADMGSIFPYKYQKNTTRANLTVSRLVKGMDVFSDDDAYEIATHHVGKPNNFVTAVLCYWIGVGQYSKFSKLIKEMLKVSFHRWTSTFKELHALLRLSNFLSDEELEEKERHNMLYLELLVGKEVEETDWRKEIEDRTWERDLPDHKAYDPELMMWTEAQYRKDFEHALTMSYSRLGKGSDRSVPDFESFYKRRASWLTKGSIVFNDLDAEFKKYTVDLINEVGEVVSQVQSRHNKKSLFEVMDAIPLLGSRFELFNASKIVTKLDENGHKRRALLPGSLLHYLVFAYVLHFVEQDNQIGNVRLNGPPDDEITYFEQKMSVVPRLLFDWSNFNLYHSTYEMSKVIERLGTVIDAPEDYKYYVQAVADSMYHMVIIDPEGVEHKAGRGLFSGWRGTTAINTVLNDGYNKAAEMSFTRLYGREPYRYVDGGGDDHDGGLNRAEDGYKMLAIMRKMNFRSNPIKQMVAMKSEFFRNTVTVHGAYASPVRALVTFINGKWEGTGNVPLKERVTSILDQIAKVRRRGVDAQFCNTMGVMCLSHWCKVREGEEWLDLPPEVIHGSLECGGFGVPDNQGRVWVLKERVPEPAMTEDMLEPPGTMATRDWISILCREVEQLNIDVTVSREKISEMAEASFDVYRKYDFTNVVKFRSEVLEKKPAVESRINEVAWAGLMDYVATERKEAKVGRLMRYQELIPYMTIDGTSVTEQQLCEVLGLGIDTDVLRFSGDIYYRRLIAEPLAKVVTEFCLECVARRVMDLGMAEDMFKDLCYMMYMNTEFRM